MTEVTQQENTIDSAIYTQILSPENLVRENFILEPEMSLEDINDTDDEYTKKTKLIHNEVVNAYNEDLESTKITSELFYKLDAELLENKMKSKVYHEQFGGTNKIPQSDLKNIKICAAITKNTIDFMLLSKNNVFSQSLKLKQSDFDRDNFNPYIHVKMRAKSSYDQNDWNTILMNNCLTDDCRLIEFQIPFWEKFQNGKCGKIIAVYELYQNNPILTNKSIDKNLIGHIQQRIDKDIKIFKVQSVKLSNQTLSQKEPNLFNIILNAVINKIKKSKVKVVNKTELKTSIVAQVANTKPSVGKIMRK